MSMYALCNNRHAVSECMVQTLLKSTTWCVWLLVNKIFIYILSFFQFSSYKYIRIEWDGYDHGTFIPRFYRQQRKGKEEEKSIRIWLAAHNRMPNSETRTRNAIYHPVMAKVEMNVLSIIFICVFILQKTHVCVRQRESTKNRREWTDQREFDWTANIKEIVK